MTWAVADPATDALLGCVDVFDLAPDADAEIGCWTHPAARGRGVATAACRAVVRHCFASPQDGGLGLERVRMRAAAGNTASQHVIEGCGFTATGRERSALRLGDGSLTDLLTYDLLPTDPLVEERSAG